MSNVVNLTLRWIKDGIAYMDDVIKDKDTKCEISFSVPPKCREKLIIGKRYEIKYWGDYYKTEWVLVRNIVEIKSEDGEIIYP